MELLRNKKIHALSVASVTVVIRKYMHTMELQLTIIHQRMNTRYNCHTHYFIFNSITSNLSVQHFHHYCSYIQVIWCPVFYLKERKTTVGVTLPVVLFLSEK